MSRQPFFSACPLCGEPRSAEVVTFDEPSFHRCVGCSLVDKREQREGLSGEGLSGGCSSAPAEAGADSSPP